MSNTTKNKKGDNTMKLTTQEQNHINSQLERYAEILRNECMNDSNEWTDAEMERYISKELKKYRKQLEKEAIEATN